MSFICIDWYVTLGGAGWHQSFGPEGRARAGGLLEDRAVFRGFGLEAGSKGDV